MPETLSSPAPAKVNLVLEVTGRRADGYHEIDTVLHTLALADTVTLRLEPRPLAPGVPRVRVTGPFAAGCPTGESNLAWRAAAHLAAALGRDPAGLSIELDKQIPAAAGLGGGASDAATALHLASQIWPEARDDVLLDAANATGSDEAFFLAGGAARATGRGDHVTSLPPLPAHGVVLFVPPFTIERKTARMFEALGHLPFDPGGVARAFATRPPACFRSEDVYNAFERVAFDLFPALAGLWQDLERRTSRAVRLAGAGPTLFWIGPGAERESVARAARGAACTVIATCTAESQWRR